MIHLPSPSFSYVYNLAVFIFSAYILYFSLRAIYQLCISPLSVIPGPWYAAISDFWLMTHVVRLQQCKAIQDLFETYGPVVRVGPNKVVFCDPHSTKTVYHKFDKSSFYKSLLTYVAGAFEPFSCYFNLRIGLYSNDNDHA